MLDLTKRAYGVEVNKWSTIADKNGKEYLRTFFNQQI